MLEGFFAESELAGVRAARLATVVHDMEQVRMLEKHVLSRPLEVFIKVNAGMNRLGFAPRRRRRRVPRLDALRRRWRRSG